MVDNLAGSFSILIPILLAVALGIFAWLAARSRNIKTFQFQISVFIVIWIIGEIVDLLTEEEFVPELANGDLEMYIHLSAMIIFSAMLWIRFYMSGKSAKRLADTLQGT